MREQKILALAEYKDAGAGSGEFEGRASTFDAVDSYGDSVAPGAYAETIPEFLKRGFISWHHEWDNPIAMVVAAEERPDGLWIKGEFHSDPQAQVYRTRVRERMAKGMFTGLSIGYEAVDWEMRDQVRILKKIKLYEVSLVSVPAESNAGLSAIKGHGLTLDQHGELTLETIDEYLERIKAGVAKELKVGRAVSAARLARVEAVIEGIAARLDELRSIVDSDPGSGTDEDEESVVGLGADDDQGSEAGKAAAIPEEPPAAPAEPALDEWQRSLKAALSRHHIDLE
jgi:HK97 family phage prohead protease